MTLYVPTWIAWTVFALWPWAFIAVRVATYEPSGGWLDVDVLGFAMVVFALAWTLAVASGGFALWVAA